MQLSNGANHIIMSNGAKLTSGGMWMDVSSRDKKNLDGLNYLAGKDIEYVNRIAYQATASAHYEGGVPNMTIEIPERSPFALWQLFYLCEKMIAISGLLSGVNPFDQPGVEAYKKKMFRLLGKPGA